jgi:hypothetical protein
MILDDLTACRAECERLRTIVNLACAAQEAAPIGLDGRVVDGGGWDAWAKAYGAFDAAVVAEIERTGHR